MKILICAGDLSEKLLKSVSKKKANAISIACNRSILEVLQQAINNGLNYDKLAILGFALDNLPDKDVSSVFTAIKEIAYTLPASKEIVIINKNGKDRDLSLEYFRQLKGLPTVRFIGVQALNVSKLMDYITGNIQQEEDEAFIKLREKNKAFGQVPQMIEMDKTGVNTRTAVGRDIENKRSESTQQGASEVPRRGNGFYQIESHGAQQKQSNRSNISLGATQLDAISGSIKELQMPDLSGIEMAGRNKNLEPPVRDSTQREAIGFSYEQPSVALDDLTEDKEWEEDSKDLKEGNEWEEVGKDLAEDLTEDNEWKEDGKDLAEESNKDFEVQESTQEKSSLLKKMFRRKQASESIENINQGKKPPEETTNFSKQSKEYAMKETASTKSKAPKTGKPSPKFKMNRSKIEEMLKRQKVITITGNERSGKSGIIANLGMMANTCGIKTLIIDMDFYGRGQSLYFPQDINPEESFYTNGVANALRSPYNYTDYIWNIDANLDILGLDISVGDIKSYEDSIGSDKLRDLLSNTRTAYDLILIDMPYKYVNKFDSINSISDRIGFVTENDISSLVGIVNKMQPEVFNTLTDYQLFRSKCGFIINKYNTTCTIGENLIEPSNLTLYLDDIINGYDFNKHPVYGCLETVDNFNKQLDGGTLLAENSGFDQLFFDMLYCFYL